MVKIHFAQKRNDDTVLQSNLWQNADLPTHLRASAPQLLLLIALVGAGGHAVATQSLLRDVDLGSLYWSLFFAVSLASFLRLSWFGVPLGRSRRRARPAPAPRVVPSADAVAPRRARLPR